MTSRTSFSCLARTARHTRSLRVCSRRSYSSPASDQVRIVEVGPRDGLQNEKQSIPLETKLDLIQRLAGTGVRTIEAGSFVSPKWTPQMANSSEILSQIMESPPSSQDPITYQFLVPNAKGLDNFLSTLPAQTPPTDSGPALNTSSQDPNAMPSDPSPTPTTPEVELAIFTAATETFTQKNTNCSIAESLTRFKPILERCRELHPPLRVRAYISVALGCPYEGPNVNPHAVADLAISLLEMGAYEISVADTTGMGTAPRTAELLKTLSTAGVDVGDLALHFHDTYGQALVNACVGLEHGVRVFDSAVGGLGGCPFSPGATGNVATEDLVHMMHSLGINTGIDIAAMAETGEWISEKVGRANESRAGKATLAKMRRQ